MSISLALKARRPEKVPEKSNFSATCSLLSQYLKEKGSLGDLNLRIKGNGETHRTTVTVNLLSSLETPPAAKDVEQAPSAGLFPLGDTKTDSSETESVVSESGQMTIFYAGRVIVFDNFTAEKAKKVMDLASKTTNNNNNSNNNNVSSAQSAPAPAAPLHGLRDHLDVPSRAIASGDYLFYFLFFLSHLPIARKASLHRFLEKRKDRITSKAPYQTSSPSVPPPTKLEEKKPWLGLASQGV
ncbi:Protein TIFY 10A [Acorus gramineus]|uniref:Protein TIFY n=1 Tax=Acorus gramineus TaxID=55184 RepID=A0AAV9AHM2_ACOGR|nr:Protein TIFY 10A [Acorus gramineus]